MKQIWAAISGAFDERDLAFICGLALVAAGLLRVSATLTLLCVGGILLFVALRR